MYTVKRAGQQSQIFLEQWVRIATFLIVQDLLYLCHERSYLVHLDSCDPEKESYIFFYLKHFILNMPSRVAG